MKIQLDTTAKTIRVEQVISLGDFVDTLERLLPGGAWKSFKLETNTIINWGNPIYIDRWMPYTPYPWWQNPVIYCGDTVGTLTYSDNNTLATTYNIEV